MADNIATGLKGFSDRFKKKNQTLWEMLVFWLMGGITTVVDLGIFAVCNYWLFAAYRDVGVSWWVFDYRVENGGLCALISLATSFALSQAVNFVIQRKATFSATNNVLYSAIVYAVMVVGVYFFMLWLPTVISEPIFGWLGAGVGAIVVKLLCQFASFLIEFPISKWVIMRKKPDDAKPSGNADAA